VTPPVPLVLVTRPQPDADRTAQEVRLRGHQPLVDPLMRICDLPADLPALTARAISILALPRMIPRPRSSATAQRSSENCGRRITNSLLPEALVREKLEPLRGR